MWFSFWWNSDDQRIVPITYFYVEVNSCKGQNNSSVVHNESRLKPPWIFPGWHDHTSSVSHVSEDRGASSVLLYTGATSREGEIPGIDRSPSLSEEL